MPVRVMEELRRLFSVASILMVVGTIECLNNGLARTPPMGWMQWERFRCDTDCKTDPDNCISENLFKQIADAMVDKGFKRAGYQYVSIDDCWMLPERGPDRRLQPDPARFPNGIKALADYIHSKGLKLGIYADMGLHTCKMYPGSKFDLQLDAETFASWGVDMLKLDCCWAGGLVDLETGYQAMSLLLNQTGRHILYSCSWPACSGGKSKYDLISAHCNMWRNYNDLRDDFHYVYAAIDFYGNDSGHFREKAGPGGWNDPDQLVLGNYGLSYDQERSQMGMWCMLASPLFMSVDVRNIRQSSQDLLLNKNLLYINQDPLGIQAIRVSKKDGLEAWVKPLTGYRYAIAVLQYYDYGGPLVYTATLKSLGLDNTSGYQMTEAFDNKDMGILKPDDELKLTVNPTGIEIVLALPLE